jgi:hypothetical protein
MAVVFIIGKFFSRLLSIGFKRKLLCIRQDHASCQDNFLFFLRGRFSEVAGAVAEFEFFFA